MIVDGKLLNLVDRLHELKQRRDQIDNEIAQAASELVSYCRGQEAVTTNVMPPVSPLANGTGPAAPLPIWTAVGDYPAVAGHK